MTDLSLQTQPLRLFAFPFSIGDIINVIKALDQSKTHGHDEVSVRMIKLCVSSIPKPLHITYQNCLENGSFLKEWRQAN